MVHAGQTPLPPNPDELDALLELDETPEPPAPPMPLVEVEELLELVLNNEPPSPDDVDDEDALPLEVLEVSSGTLTVPYSSRQEAPKSVVSPINKTICAEFVVFFMVLNQA